MGLVAEVPENILSNTLDLPSGILDIAIKGQIRSNT